MTCGKDNEFDAMKTIQQLFDLTGRVAIVTGGDGLLGFQMAWALAEAGAHVIVASLEGERCRQLASQLQAKYAPAMGIEFDQTRPDLVDGLIHATLDRFGRIDILVNNAAMNVPGSPVEELSAAEWRRYFDTNVYGVFLCCHAVGEVMKAAGKGSIVNVASIYGVVSPDHRIYGDTGMNSALPYGAGKSAVIQMTRYLATYWASDGVRVNSLTPGGFYNHQRDEFVANYCARVPLGRMGKETDLKGAIVFLAADASAYVTGHNLVVDGGLTVW